MWLAGDSMEEEHPPIMDLDTMKADGAKLGGYCGLNPTVGLITSAEQVLKTK